MEKKTLLQKAKEVNVNKIRSDFNNDEEHEIAIAWAKGELSFRQIQMACNFKGVNSVYVLLSKSFKRIVNEKIKIKT